LSIIVLCLKSTLLNKNTFLIVKNSLQFHPKFSMIVKLALMETASFTAGVRQER
jgi:hypothetical protein